ncbi:MAG TPA: hypothetical protein PKA21_16730, partial [Kiritimatiellia bacterium]|nr:hypothetical protein [Kiritimatiellia bacterium]
MTARSSPETLFGIVGQSQAGSRRRGVVCPSVPPAVLSRAARSSDQRPPLRLAGRRSPTTDSARWTTRLPGPRATRGLPDGFPRFTLRLRRSKRSGALHDLHWLDDEGNMNV